MHAHSARARNWHPDTGWSGYLAGMLPFAGAVTRSALSLPRSSVPDMYRIFLNQVHFTAVEAIPLLGFVALIAGLPVLIVAQNQAAQFGFSDMFGKLLIMVVVREVGPFLAALIVVTRSGSAVCAELAASTAAGETEALEVLGVDPLQYHVLPRVLAFAVSVPVLIVLFNAATLTAGAVLTWRGGELAIFESSVRSTAVMADLWVPMIKGAVAGVGIALLCCLAGLTTGPDPNRIPISVSDGVLSSLLWVLGTSVAITLATGAL